jgi:acetylornithine deacetylase/succinyl-diaminopimelate desuccinylase-like protein
MVDHHWDAVGAPYVLTESGGWSNVSAAGTRHVTFNVAEKGIAWRRLRVSGTPGHGSMPYGADNALITAAEVVRRLVAYRPAPNLDDLWQARLGALDLPDDLRAALSDPDRVYETIAGLPTPVARIAHACSHTTISPNVIHGGQKTNTIPDVIDIDVDIRTVPGDTAEVVDGYLAEALGELADRVEVSIIQANEPTRSPTDNPLWEALRTRTQVAYPGAELVPGIITGGTDARFYRAKGSVAYGAALFSPTVTFEQFGNRFHGNDERIDVESLGMSTDFWYHIAKEMVG